MKNNFPITLVCILIKYFIFKFFQTIINFDLHCLDHLSLRKNLINNEAEGEREKELKRKQIINTTMKEFKNIVEKTWWKITLKIGPFGLKRKGYFGGFFFTNVSLFLLSIKTISSNLGGSIIYTNMPIIPK